MGISRRINRKKHSKIDIEIKELLENIKISNEILNDYIPKAEDIVFSLESIVNSYPQHQDENLKDIAENMTVEAKETMGMLEEAKADFDSKSGITDMGAWLLAADNRMEMLEVINSVYLAKATMVELHKEFALKIETILAEGTVNG